MQKERDFETKKCSVKIEEVVESGRLVNEKRTGHLRLKSLFICDRSMDSRYKKQEKNVRMGCPRMRPSGNRQAISTLPQSREGDCTTTMRWLVVVAEALNH